MAGKKGSRSSKTAHVLNLLSGGEAPEAPEQRPAAGTERTEEPVSYTHLTLPTT